MSDPIELRILEQAPPAILFQQFLNALTGSAQKIIRGMVLDLKYFFIILKLRK